MPAVTPDQIEAAIHTPARDQLDLFLDFEWLVPVVHGQIWGSYEAPPFTTDYLFTRPERFEPLCASNQQGKEYEAKPYPLMSPDGWNVARPMQYRSTLEQCELVHMRFRTILERAAQRGDYHTIHINSGCGTYDDKRRHGELRMPCGWTPLWLEGVDARPEARVLPAKSIAEIHLFMGQAHLVGDLTHQLEYIEGELAAIYEGVDVSNDAKRQAFTLVEALSDPRDYGPGASEILCGGMMAYMMDGHRWDVENNFHEGTRAGLRDFMPNLMRQLDEILKMLDPTTDQVPPRCFRTEFAPSFVKIKPHVITGAWLRETRRLFGEFIRLP
jgi:hypothetical protein